jgi:hypothetical protein
MRRHSPFRSSDGGWRDSGIYVCGEAGRLADTELIEAAVVALRTRGGCR